jgi:hypothetical protein
MASLTLVVPAAAEELQGVAFDSILVSLDGRSSTQLLWRDCSGATTYTESIECEAEGMATRAGSAPACLTVEVSQPSANRVFGWSNDYRLVRRIVNEASLIGANGVRGCHLEGEIKYRGLYRLAFELSAFSAAPGEIWWLQLEAGISEEQLAPALVNENERYLCLEARGVATPAGEDGHGHMGAYDRGFFVTEVLRTFAPDERVLAMDQVSFNQSGGDVDRVCDWSGAN